MIMGELSIDRNQDAVKERQSLSFYEANIGKLEPRTHVSKLLYQMLPAEKYEGLTPEQKSLNNSVPEGVHGMIAELIMPCRGSNCPYAEMCYLVNPSDKENAIPDDKIVGVLCLLELAKVRILFAAFRQELLKDSEEPELTVADLMLLVELIRVELQQTRIDKRLMVEGDVIEQPISVTEFGTVTQKQAHPLTDVAGKLARRKDAAMKMLVADRLSKQKTGKKAQVDTSRYYAELRKKAEGAKIKRAKRTVEVVVEETIEPDDDVEVIPLP